MSNNYQSEPQIFFVIGIKNDRGEMQSSTLSIQDLNKADELFQNKFDESYPLIAMNYKTSVTWVDGFKNQAKISITHRTRQGNTQQILMLDENSYQTYEDENVVVYCGVADLNKLPANATDAQEKEVINSIINTVSKRLGKKIGALTNNSDPEPNA